MITTALEELKKELKQAEAKVKRIQEEKVTCGRRLTNAKEKMGSLKSTFETIRKERQKELVDGGDISGLNSKFKQAREDMELLEDEISGLTDKLSRLEAETSPTYRRSMELKQLLLVEEKGRPLVSRYNELVKELANVQTELHAAINEFNAHRLAGMGGFLVHHLNGSDIPLKKLPLLALGGEPREALAYDHDVIAAQHRSDAIKRQSYSFQEALAEKCSPSSGIHKEATQKADAHLGQDR